MSRIRGSGNKDTELALIAVFRKWHITGWRRHQALLGKPDFVFQVQRLVVFVDGCFWHGCTIHANIPKNNRRFWMRKIKSNKQRDRFVTQELRKNRWRVLRIWEHELSRPDLVSARVRRAMK